MPDETLTVMDTMPNLKKERHMLLSAAVLCLATNIYFESRGEPFWGQVAVAYVTHNRVKASGRTYCEEVYAPKQFSWTEDKSLKIDFSSEQWRQAVIVAKNFKKWEDITKGATHFHNYTVMPAWSKKLILSVVIGGHTFYR